MLLGENSLVEKKKKIQVRSKRKEYNSLMLNGIWK